MDNNKTLVLNFIVIKHNKPAKAHLEYKHLSENPDPALLAAAANFLAGADWLVNSKGEVLLPEAVPNGVNYKDVVKTAIVAAPSVS